MSGKKNTLTRPEQRALEDLVAEHGDEIKQGRWTQVAFAKFAEKRFSRPVTPGNVRGAALAVGVPFPVTSGQDAGRSLRELRACVLLLAAEVAFCLRRLGGSLSTELEELEKIAYSDLAHLKEQADERKEKEQAGQAEEGQAGRPTDQASPFGYGEERGN